MSPSAGQTFYWRCVAISICASVCSVPWQSKIGSKLSPKSFEKILTIQSPALEPGARFCDEASDQPTELLCPVSWDLIFCKCLTPQTYSPIPCQTRVHGTLALPRMMIYPWLQRISLHDSITDFRYPFLSIKRP
jgi:hypothetical protein